MHRRSLVASASAVLLLLAACSGGDDDAAPSKGAAGSSSTSTTASPSADGATSTTSARSSGGSSGTAGCKPGSADPNELEGLMPAALPAGFERQADDVGDTGPSDLDKAVRDDGEPDARKVLTDAGFLRGYQRYWASASEQADLVAFVYEFCGPDGAATYQARVAGWAEAPELQATKFTVPGVPGAKGYVDVDTEQGYREADVLATVGHFSIEATAGGPAGSFSEQRAEELAIGLAKQLADIAARGTAA